MNEHNQRRLADLLASGLSCREAASALGVSPATAIRWTKRAGLVSRRSRRLAPDTREGLQRLLSEGASPAEAAARFGVNPRTAARLIDPADLARRRAAMRDRLLASLRDGQPLRDASSEAGVSLSTAGRWARQAGLPPAALRRRGQREDEAKALAAMEAGMSPAEAAETFALPPAAMSRLTRRPRLKAERLARRRELFAALATGLSCRKAAALLDMPVATAIRWAREGRETRQEPQSL